MNPMLTVAALLFVPALLPPPMQVAPRPVVWRSQKKGKWDASANLVDLGGGVLAKLAGAVMGNAERRLFDEFVREASRYFASPSADAPAPWSYEMASTATRRHDKVVSVLVEAYSYLGGAHGIGVKRTYNFGFVAGKAKRLSLADCLVGSSSVRELRLRLLEKAMNTPGTDWIEGGEVRDFTREQLDRFWIGKDGLTFEFNPYELGSYASGPFSFKFTWRELKGLVRTDGPLGAISR